MEGEEKADCIWRAKEMVEMAAQNEQRGGVLWVSESPAQEKLTNFGSLGRPSAPMPFALKRISM